MAKLIKPNPRPNITLGGNPDLSEEEIPNKIEEKPVQITAQEPSTEESKTATVQPPAKVRRTGGRFVNSGAGLTRVS